MAPPAEPEQQAREEYAREKDRRAGTASLLARFSKKELSFSGEAGKGLTLRQFANDALLYGNLSLMTTEGIDIPMSVQFDLMMSGWLTSRAKVWWEQNKSAYDDKTWPEVIQGLITAFVDPLEKKALAREFVGLTQHKGEEMFDYIGRTQDLLARAEQVEFTTTPDVVWSVFTAGLTARFTHAASVLDLVSSGQDCWPEGAERLRRWEMANPVPKHHLGSESAKNSSPNSNNNTNNSSVRNTSSSSNTSNRWLSKKKYDGASGAKARNGKSGVSAGASSPAATAEADLREAGKKCYNCGQLGHLAWRCPDKDKPQRKPRHE
jgi:hypothetical protein